MTIPSGNSNFGADPSSLALSALGWVLSDTIRAQRFLDLTGLTPEELRESLAEPMTQRAVLDFLASHEPDLISAAEALEISPETLIAAGKELSSNS